MRDDGEQQTHQAPSPQHQIRDLDLDSLIVISALGRGAKGVVFLVRDGDENSNGGDGGVGECLALKVILRESIEKKKRRDSTGDGDEYKRVCFEQRVLSRFDHPLLPRLRGVLATDKVVGYAIDYCPGRDLNSLRRKQTERMFSDEILRFYAAEMVLALEYLHEQGIVYRDLKPENIMIQENGHIMIVDFDLSTNLRPRTPQPSPIPTPTVKPPAKKRFFPFLVCCSSGISPNSVSTTAVAGSDSSVEKSNSFVGTEEYLAPEVILGDGHDFAVDWWSLGVVLYEMLYGTTPFKGSNRKETFFRILARLPDLVGETTPLRYLIGKLLEKDPSRRITLEGIKSHEFFKGVDWDQVLGISRPPYIPSREKEEGNKDREGIKKNDVENFVQRIFTDNNSANNQNNVWVKGLNNDPFEANNFWIF